jgi:type IV pilus assembly protein PilX
MEPSKMKLSFLSHASRLPHPPSRQRGVVLLVSLLFLIVLTLLGVAASRVVAGEEKMSRYLREYNTAFQAAESAMRDARDDVDGFLVIGGTYKSRLNSSATFFADCSFGQCLFNPTETSPPWMDEAKWANAAAYGTYSRRSPLPKAGVVGTNADTNARDGDTEAAVARYDAGSTNSSTVTGVWKQPAYLVELIPDQRPGANSVEFGKNPPPLYRITARGYGADPNSGAMVQEIYTSSINSTVN